MATQFDKFIATMKKVLMLDQADLDFGIYRIMNRKRDQIESYLNNDLRRQVAELSARMPPMMRKPCKRSWQSWFLR